MSKNLLADLREITEVARLLQSLREQAEGVVTTSDEVLNREDAITAIALIQDQRMLLRVAFDSLGVRSFQFDGLLDQTDEDLVRAQAVKDGQAVYDLRDGELGNSVPNDVVLVALEKALPIRLELIRTGIESIKHLIT